MTEVIQYLIAGIVVMWILLMVTERIFYVIITTLAVLRKTLKQLGVI